MAEANGLINLQKDAQKDAVAKIYAKMNPGDAVKILEGMLPDRAAVILGGMGESQAAGVLAAMDPERAQLLTEIMAGYTPAPATPGAEPARPATTPIPAAPVPAPPQPGTNPGAEIKPPTEGPIQPEDDAADPDS